MSEQNNTQFNQQCSSYQEAQRVVDKRYQEDPQSHTNWAQCKEKDCVVRAYITDKSGAFVSRADGDPVCGKLKQQRIAEEKLRRADIVTGCFFQTRAMELALVGQNIQACIMPGCEFKVDGETGELTDSTKRRCGDINFDATNFSACRNYTHDPVCEEQGNCGTLCQIEERYIPSNAADSDSLTFTSSIEYAQKKKCAVFKPPRIDSENISFDTCQYSTLCGEKGECYARKAVIDQLGYGVEQQEGVENTGVYTGGFHEGYDQIKRLVDRYADSAQNDGCVDPQAIRNLAK